MALKILGVKISVFPALSSFIALYARGCSKVLRSRVIGWEYRVENPSDSSHLASLYLLLRYL
jgi:hypothetical protein